MAERVTFMSERPSGRVELEGMFSPPDKAGESPGVVLCHPHPAGGGEMTLGLFDVMEFRMNKAGLAVLRFNFGGVGGSKGAFTEGLEEPADVAAAFGYLSARSEVDSADVSLSGWSFGAWMCLLALAEGLGARACVAIAPPLMLYDWHPYVERVAASPAAIHYIIGANDQFCPLDFLEAFVFEASGEQEQDIMVMPSTDHYLMGREDMVAELVIEDLNK